MKQKFRQRIADQKKKYAAIQIEGVVSNHTTCAASAVPAMYEMKYSLVITLTYTTKKLAWSCPE